MTDIPGDAKQAGTVFGMPVLTSESEGFNIRIVVPRCQEALMGYTCKYPRGHAGPHRDGGLTWQVDSQFIEPYVDDIKREFAKKDRGRVT